MKVWLIMYLGLVMQLIPASHFYILTDQLFQFTYLNSSFIQSHSKNTDHLNYFQCKHHFAATLKQVYYKGPCNKCF